MRFVSIYIHTSPTSQLQSFIILLCNAGSSATVIISWETAGDGRRGCPKGSLPPKQGRKCGEKGLYLCDHTKPPIPKFAHALGSERLGRGNKELPVACDQLDAEPKPSSFLPFGTSRGASVLSNSSALHLSTSCRHH